MRCDPALLFSVSVSIFGILISLIFAFNPPVIQENFLWRKLMVGAAFGSICVLGIIAALFPRKCSQTFHFQKQKNASHNFNSNFKGHHPQCPEFSAHVIHVNKHTLCAACSGMILGAFITLVGTVLYFFDWWQIEELSLLLILIGIAGLTLGFFQLKFKSFIRLFLNAVFVFGAFLILIGFDALAHNLLFDFFLILLVIFWLFTRIKLSQWDHLKICSSCKISCVIREVDKN